MSGLVFSYWEGEPYPFTDLCLGSLSRVFGDRHVHLTPASIGEWIDLPDAVAATDHFSFRCDYVRTLLLERHGGWWFDADILLVEDPSPLIKPSMPAIWTLIYRVEGEWVPLINCGILFSPAGSSWITAIARDFAEVDLAELEELTWENEDVGQDIYERRSLEMDGAVSVGGPHEFNSTVNVDADYAPFWDGTISLDSANYGIHIGASLSRWAARDGAGQARETLECESLNELVRRFPRSVVAQYLQRVGDGALSEVPQQERDQ
jgi:hypothetical protein